MKEIKIDTNAYLEMQQIRNGTFHPLDSFMDRNCLESVVENMSLENNEIFSLPILLPISELTYKNIKSSTEVRVTYRNRYAGRLLIKDIYNFDLKKA